MVIDSNALEEKNTNLMTNNYKPINVASIFGVPILVGRGIDFYFSLNDYF